jgi:hypothetical protein
MGQILQAQVYWKHLQLNPIKRALSRTPASWFQERWLEEIPYKLKLLAQLQKKVAQSLARIERQPYSDEREYKFLKKEIKKTLERCDIPAFYKRFWVPLTITAGSIAASIHHQERIFHYLISFLPQDNERIIMYTFTGNQENIRELKLACLNHSQLPNISTVIIGEKVHLSAHQKNSGAIRAILNTQGLRDAFERSDPLSYKEYGIYLYNKLREWTVDPLLEAQEEHRQALIEVNQNILDLGTPEQKDVFTAAERAMKSVSQARKNSILKLTRSRSQAFPPADNGQREVSRRVRELIFDVMSGVRAIGGYIYHQPEAMTSLDNSYFASLKKESYYYLESTKFSLKALAGSFLMYKLSAPTVRFMYNTATANYSIRALKSQLTSYERLLNYCRKDDELSPYYQGMIYYFNNRIKQYRSKVPSAFEARFIQDCDDLENPDHSAEQKHAIIQAMLRDFSFLN